MDDEGAEVEAAETTNMGGAHCPECGNQSMIMQGGCGTCMVCAFSYCG